MAKGDASNTLNLGISSEEFEQYQRQFIEERSEKYALLEKVRRLEQENSKLSAERGDKEFDKLLKDRFQKPLQNLLARNKRESESEHVYGENDALQKRLHSQEEDFQRQNALLMQELQNLVNKNEELEMKFRSVYSSQSQDPVLQTRIDSLEAEIRSLHVERSVYQKPSIPPFSDDVDSEASVVNQQTLDELSAKLAASNQERLFVQKQLDAEKKNAQQIRLDAEKTIARVNKDLESKQTTVQILLAEREQVQRAAEDQLKLVVAEKENIRTTMTKDLEKQREENFRLRQVVEDEKVMSKARSEDVERQMRDLLEQIDVTGQQTKRDHDELLAEHKKQIASLLQEVELLNKTNGDLQKLTLEQENLVKELTVQKDHLASSEAELFRLSEKRKATIDDLTTHLSALQQQHHVQMQHKETEMLDLIAQLKRKLASSETEAGKLPVLRLELENLNIIARALEEENGKLSALLADGKLTVEKLKTDLENVIIEAKTKFEDATAKSSSEIHQLSQDLAKMTVQYNEMTSVTTDLEQQLHDKSEELKIVDRKNAGIVRDLQKQLQSEKKRVEKLQSRLNELLRDGTIKPRQTPDDSSDFTERDETGSVSSWSFVSSKSNGKKPVGDTGSAGSHTETETGLAATMTDQEIRDLVTRVTKLQQEKSSLIERVSMLETGNAAMAEDLLSKSAIINRYMQTTPVLGHHGHQHNSKGDTDLKTSLRNVIDRLGRDKSIDLETQKNLRLLLEETLTKNIHLQKNMELLTEELDRLRGSSPPRSQ